MHDRALTGIALLEVALQRDGYNIVRKNPELPYLMVVLGEDVVILSVREAQDDFSFNIINGTTTTGGTLAEVAKLATRMDGMTIATLITHETKALATPIPPEPETLESDLHLA